MSWSGFMDLAARVTAKVVLEISRKWLALRSKLEGWTKRIALDVARLRKILTQYAARALGIVAGLLMYCVLIISFGGLRLVFITIIISFIALMTARAFVSDASFVDNLLAGLIGTAFTVFAVEEILRTTEKAQRRPALEMALSQVLILYRRVRHFWAEVCKEHVRQENWVALRDSWPSIAPDKRNLYKYGVIRAVVESFDVSKDSGKSGSAWLDRVRLEVSVVQRHIDKCLDRYVMLLPSEMVAALHRIEDDVFVVASLLNNTHQSNICDLETRQIFVDHISRAFSELSYLLARLEIVAKDEAIRSIIIPPQSFEEDMLYICGLAGDMKKV
jgi:hypothetical protein